MLAKFESNCVRPSFPRRTKSSASDPAAASSAWCCFLFMDCPRKTDARINHAVENIDYEHDAYVHCAVYKAERYDNIIIIRSYRGDKQRAYSRNGKYFFNNKRTGHKIDDKRCKNSDDRYERIAERMTPDKTESVHAFAFRKFHIFASERFKHFCPRKTRN